jgi:hypothetical protein
MTRDSARNVMRLKREEADISKMLEELTKNSPEVQMLKQTLGADGTGLIIAPCHNIQAITPVENILAMYEEAAV